MHGVRLSSSPNPKKAAALAAMPSVASRQAIRSVSESAAPAGGEPAGEAAGAEGPAAAPGVAPGAAPPNRTERAFWIGG